VPRKRSVHRRTWAWIRLKFAFEHKSTDYECMEDEAQFSDLSRIHGTWKVTKYKSSMFRCLQVIN